MHRLACMTYRVIKGETEIFMVVSIVNVLYADELPERSSVGKSAYRTGLNFGRQLFLIFKEIYFMFIFVYCTH